MLCVLASAGAAQPPAEVTFDPVSQTVSVSATAVPRGALVAEIARQSGVRLVTDDPLPLPISVAAAEHSGCPHPEALAPSTMS